MKRMHESHWEVAPKSGGQIQFEVHHEKTRLRVADSQQCFDLAAKVWLSNKELARLHKLVGEVIKARRDHEIRLKADMREYCEQIWR